MKRWIIILLFALPGFGISQIMPPDGVFQIFETSLQGEAVEVVWMVWEGSQCYDVEVQRSWDAVNFETIHTVPGICGGDIRYTFVDRNPYPYRENYYRLRSGTGDKSWVVHFDYQFLENERAWQVFPHPVNQQASFVFRNPNFESRTLELYDQNGVLKKRLASNYSNEIPLFREGLPAGMYIFLLRDAKGVILDRGRITFQ